jgi:thiol-disulfide isomerase/thioredoxin
MFKRIYLLLASVTLAGVMDTYAQQAYTINGKLSPTIGGTVTLDYDDYAGDKKVYIQDSATVKNGVFVLSGKISCPVYAHINLRKPNESGEMKAFSWAFYLAPGATLIKGTDGLGNITVSGTKAGEEYDSLMKQKRPLSDSISRITASGHELADAMNMNGIKEMQKKAAPFFKMQSNIDSVFILKHPDSQVAFDLRFRHIEINRAHIKEIAAGLNEFTANVKQLPPARIIRQKQAVFEQIQPGKTAPAFTLNDASGKPVSLSAYKGRYVLVVFTGYSGRMGLESVLFNLKNIDLKLKMDDFSMVTLLSDKDMLLPAKIIHDNELNWVHLNSNEEIAKAYGISEYGDDALLIGPDGKFIKTDITFSTDITTQIKGFIPGVQNQVVKGLTSSSTVAGNSPLNVYLGDEITEYPKVEWLKGGPVTRFSKDTIYIVELWATWCVPCIAAMPHLSELQRKFKDKKVVVIAQQIWEDDKTKVAAFVKKKGADLDYLVAYSGPKGSDFDNRWCKPAQVDAIPRTFVIQDGKLVWQTYPTMLNEANLQLLVDKKFTVEKAEALSGKK